MSYGVAKIFPTLLFEIDCSELLEDTLKILDGVEWRDLEVNDSSIDKFVLSEYPELSSAFDDKVNECLNGELSYRVPMKMSTSWFTRTPTGSIVNEHKHTNSLWSSVFYFDDVSSIIFNKRETPMIDVKFESYDPGVIPYGHAIFPAKKGQMILFPSDLYHWTNENEDDKYRYSLAMNFMPHGMCYDNDSSYHYQ